MEALETFDMVFAIGPAEREKPTGCVYGCLRAALQASHSNILARPAVEAGERLGFLPGTLQEKSIPTCARSMMRFTTCWKRQTGEFLEKALSRLRRCLHAAGAR